MWGSYAVQRKTAVTAYLKSKQLLLFAFAGQCRGEQIALSCTGQGDRLHQSAPRRFAEGNKTRYMNIALRRFLHNHGNIATEGSRKPGLCPTLISNDFKGSL